MDQLIGALILNQLIDPAPTLTISKLSKTHKMNQLCEAWPREGKGRKNSKEDKEQKGEMRESEKRITLQTPPPPTGEYHPPFSSQTRFKSSLGHRGGRGVDQNRARHYSITHPTPHLSYPPKWVCTYFPVQGVPCPQVGACLLKRATPKSGAVADWLAVRCCISELLCTCCNV